MTLIACPECAKQISTSATTCPSCGYPLARKQLTSTLATNVKRAIEIPAPISPLCVEEINRLIDGMQPLKKAPSLRRFNGLGYCPGTLVHLYSKEGLHYGLLQINETLLFLPVIKGRWYIVQYMGTSSFKFFGEVPKAVVATVEGSANLRQAHRQQWVKGWVELSIVVGMIVLLALLVQR